jgi:heme exporter protein B
MLPVLLLPLAIPLIIGAVEATRGALRADPFLMYRQWLELLLVFDLIFLVVSFWAFEWILEG